MKTYVINEFEKIVSEDLNDLQTTIHESIYDKILYPFFQKQNGVLGESFSVTRNSLTQVTVTAGRGFYYDATQVAPQPKYRAIQLSSDLVMNIGTAPWAALPSVDPRIDIIVIRPLEEVVTTENRYVKTAGTGPIVSQVVDKVKEQLYEINVVEGVENASPVAPATPAGWMKIAEVTVGLAGIASANDVADTRTVLLPAIDSFLSDTRYVDPSGNGTDTTIAAAIANLPAEGGSIFILEPITLSAPVVLPANTVLRSRGRDAIITIDNTGKIEVGDDGLVENLTIETALTNSTGLIELAGSRAKLRNVKIDVPVAGTNVCVEVSGADCEIESCDFLECDENGTNTSLLLTGSIAKGFGNSLRQDFKRQISIDDTDSPFQLLHSHSGMVINVDSSAGEVDIQLPAGKDGMNFTVKDIGGSFGTNPCNIVRDAAEEIEFLAADYACEADYGIWNFAYVGTNLQIL